MIHKNMKCYYQSGQVRDDSYLMRIRSEVIRLTEGTMRDEGYIPVHELGPYWYTCMDSNGKTFSFELVMYGIYVGKKKSKEIDFWHDGQLIRRIQSRADTTHS